MATRTIHGFGLQPTIKSEVVRPETLKQLQACVKEQEHILPTGSHKSYGDSSLHSTTIDMRRLDHVLAFDKESGIIKCESGILLSDLLEIIVPHGWFLPVTPGTKYLTLGGCAASNVHGKNHHHHGSFSESVISMDIVLADADILHCTPKRYEDLFNATLGGMGLTGSIYSIELKLKPIKSAYMDVEHIKCKDLSTLFKELEQAERDYDYTVTWIDTFTKGKQLGRGIVIAGKHSIKGGYTLHKKPLVRLPFTMPSFILNNLTLHLFDKLYYFVNKSKHTHEHYDTFFYPLDSIEHWNYLYGKRGFTQYQFVVPLTVGEKVTREVLELCQRERQPSYLAILKSFKQEDGLLSFPKEGYTLAMDFPLGNKTTKLLHKIDAIIKKNGGRLYLTKDARMEKDMLEGYERLSEWKRIRNKYDPKHKFTSQQAERLGL